MKKKINDVIKKTIQAFILPFILGLLTVFLYFYPEQSFFVWFIGKILIFITLAVHLLALFALSYSLKDNSSVTESYKKALNNFWPLFGVLILYYIVTIGAGVFFIIPGFIFLVWFSFSPYIAIFEEKRGLFALKKSRELVRADGRKTFFTLLGIFLFFMAILFSAFLLVEKFKLGPFMGYIIILTCLIALWLTLFKEYRSRENLSKSLLQLRPIRKTIFIFPLLTGSLVVFLIFNIFFRDYDSPFDDSHLVLPAVEIIPEDGNLYFFLKEEDMLYFPDKDHSSFDESKCGNIKITDPLDFIYGQYSSSYEFIVANPEKTKEIIENNRAVYSCFDRMAEHNNYIHEGSIDINMDFSMSPGEMLSMARANSFKIAYLFYEGNNKEAMNRFLDAVKVGALLADAPRPYLIEFLIGNAINSITLYEILPFLNKINITPEEAVLYVENLSAFEIKEEAFARAISMEYMFFVSIFDAAHKKTDFFKENLSEFNFLIIGSNFFERPSFFWKPEKTKRQLAEYLSPFIELEPERFMGYQEINRRFWSYVYFPPILQPYEFFLHDNIVGRISTTALILTIMPESHLNELRATNFENRAIGLALALRAHEIETGKLPDNLTELIPEYFNAVPKDPFYRDVVIGYSPEERVIYSLRKDDVSKHEKDKYIINF